MKRLLVLFVFAAMSLSAVAQTQQQLIEAYRNGTLTQSQIDELQKQSEQKQSNIQRTRTTNVTQNGIVEQSNANEVVTNMPAEPQAACKQCAC